MDERQRFHLRETGWNGKILLPGVKTPRKMISVSDEIRNFIMSSMNGLPSALTSSLDEPPSMIQQQMQSEAKRAKTMLNKSNKKRFVQQQQQQQYQQQQEGRAKNAFETISSAFGFVHHHGTDRAAELKVIKSILVREGLLMKLVHASASCRVKLPSGEEVLKPSAGAHILEILTHLRNASLDYLDNLTAWRNSSSATPSNHGSLFDLASSSSSSAAAAGANSSPRVFLWEGDNYTLKMINDVDFLAENELLVTALSQTPGNMRTNPLMLQTTLEDVNTWIDPHVRASNDAGGNIDSKYYHERLRLRLAERTMLQELECNAGHVYKVPSEMVRAYGNNQQEESSLLVMDEVDGGGGARTMLSSSGGRMPTAEMLTWQQDAVMQLGRLESMQGDTTISKSTNRLARIPKNVEDTDIKYSQPVPEWRAAPTKLTELDSSITRSRAMSRGSSTPNAGMMEGRLDSRGNNASGIAAVDNLVIKSWNGSAEAFPPESSAFDEEVLSRPRASRSRQRDGANLAPLDSIDSNVSFYESFAGAEDILAGGAEDEDYFGMDAYARQDKGTNGMLEGFLDGDFGYGADFESDDIGRGGGMYADYGDDQLNDATSGILSMQGGLITHSIDSISTFDLEMVMGIHPPPQSLMLAGAACVILLSDDVTDVTNNVSWTSFVSMATEGNLAGMMNTLDPVQVPKFKVRAIKPFLDRMKVLGNESALLVTMDAQESMEKICRWVKQVISACSSPKKAQKKQQGAPEPLPKAAVKTRTNLGKTSAKNPSPAAADRGNSSRGNERPNNKKKVPKVNLDLWPVHTEILEEAFRHPLLLTLLSSQFNSDLPPPRSYKSYDPLNLLVAAEPTPDRIVAKVYDLVDSKEAVVNINVREFTLFLYDLREKHSPDVAKYFRPASLEWWTDNLRRTVVVRSKANGNLTLLISKASIERVVMEGLGLIPIRPDVSMVQMTESNNDDNDDYLMQQQQLGRGGRDSSDNMRSNNQEPDDWGFYQDEKFESVDTVPMESISNRRQQVPQPSNRAAQREKFQKEKEKEKQSLRSEKKVDSKVRKSTPGREEGKGGVRKTEHHVPSTDAKKTKGSKGTTTSSTAVASSMASGAAAIKGAKSGVSNNEAINGGTLSSALLSIPKEQQQQQASYEEEEDFEGADYISMQVNVGEGGGASFVPAVAAASSSAVAPQALDYGDDVFEDDSEGGFEEEVDRIEKALSRGSSREDPFKGSSVSLLPPNSRGGNREHSAPASVSSTSKHQQNENLNSYLADEDDGVAVELEVEAEAPSVVTGSLIGEVPSVAQSIASLANENEEEDLYDLEQQEFEAEGSIVDTTM